jgi:hypothetical protein
MVSFEKFLLKGEMRRLSGPFKVFHAVPLHCLAIGMQLQIVHTAPAAAFVLQIGKGAMNKI